MYHLLQHLKNNPNFAYRVSLCVPYDSHNKTGINSLNSSFQVKVNVTTDSQSASLPWCQASIWGPRPDFYYCQIVSGLLMWDALSDERTSLSFTTAAGPRQHSHSRVSVSRES
jgi:hypothetical protein